MARSPHLKHHISRRKFLQTLQWSPVLFLPAPLRTWRSLPIQAASAGAEIALAEYRLKPHYYPAKSPLDDLLLQAVPGSDEYVTEKYAFEISQILAEWSRALRESPPALSIISNFLDASIETNRLTSIEEHAVRTGGGITVVRRRFATDIAIGREKFLKEIAAYLAPMSPIQTATFDIVGAEQIANSPLRCRIEIRYDLVGVLSGGGREEHIGHWDMQWLRDASGPWRVTRWQTSEELISSAREQIFVDVTPQCFASAGSYTSQMLRGVDDWRTLLDGACGIDVYGNNGVAAGDFDNDGFDDLYVCQPAGLPNRLYRNRGDGTFEDVTARAGVGVLDGTACALFADFQNRGLQDLLVVCGSGPLLFMNQGNGTFALKPGAFQFARPPQGTFTHAAVADFDHDGLLDVYFCVYSYYLGLDQYHYPAPYFDARNGPPNFLFHNDGNGAFQDRTEAAGLNIDNDRYSFACAWGDATGDGWPDLYVANDFGRGNLYRNEGGTFRTVSTDAAVEDPGAGMSACWLDFDGDGHQDIYASNMWSAAGLRISEQNNFHKNEPESIRAIYRQHAKGNSLYKNQGNGKFRNVSNEAGVGMGRWAWSSDSWDFDHDGYPDLYVANGYISGPEHLEVSSFFWRHVVGKSPAASISSPPYEQAWNAINELIRSDASWSPRERNVMYANNRDATFSEVSGVAGLDAIEDSRAFALADLDHDGRLEVILKNRNAPQLRILRNVAKELAPSIAFRLRGTKSNRDAIGAAITIESAGRAQTRYLQAGSGFLSQHTKEIFFGIPGSEPFISARIRWPGGSTQVLPQVPTNHRIEIQEGSNAFVAKPFASSPSAYSRISQPSTPRPLPDPIETWLIEPLSAPDFSLPDLTGKTFTLSSFRGTLLLLVFWQADSPSSIDQLRTLQRAHSALQAGGVRIAAVNVDEQPSTQQQMQSVAAKNGLLFPILVATPEIAGVFNIVYRYLFDRRRDMGVPTSMLIDAEGMIVKLYQGSAAPAQLLEDAKSLPRSTADRIRRALPFDGHLYQGTFQRNDFTYGVAFFQRGYLDHAAASFQQVIARKPDDSEAFYNLGTLFLRKNDFPAAREALEKTVQLRPDYPEAWNNLGMLSAQQGQAVAALRDFQRSLALRPDYTIALLNLGNLYRRQGALDKAQELLDRALSAAPDDPEANYSIAMLYAGRGQEQRAMQSLLRAVDLRPDYPEALNNLGVLLVRAQQFSEAEARFQACIRLAPNFDQAYLNLARLYVTLNNSAKAREALLALLKLQPDHKMARQALEMLN
jgi:tetratricopeptide (TPR) repeat protein